MINKATILAVDDREDHLEVLTSSLNGIGAACLPILYPGTSLHNLGITNARLVFMDINLTGAGGLADYQIHFQTIVGILTRLIPEDNGPYLLVSWTTTPEQHGNLVAFLEDPDRLPHGKQPTATICLDKDECLDDADVLTKKIESWSDNLPQAGALIHWENTVRNAANSVLKSVVELVPPVKRTTLDFSKELQRVMASLGYAAAISKEQYSTSPFSAVNNALLGILRDKLEHAEIEEIDEQKWKDAVGLPKSHRLQGEEKAKLNRMLHLAEGSEAGSAETPGAVIPLSRDLKTNFKSYFGASPLDVAFNTRKLLDTKDIGLKRGTLSSEEYQELKACKIAQHQRDILEGCQWCLIETSPACDHAQGNVGCSRYVLCLLIPVDSLKHLSSGKKGTQSEFPLGYVYQTPPFSYGSKTYVLRVNFSYEIGTAQKAIRNQQPLFRIREELLNKIIFAAAKHRSRPGIIEFR